MDRIRRSRFKRDCLVHCREQSAKCSADICKDQDRMWKLGKVPGDGEGPCRIVSFANRWISGIGRNSLAHFLSQGYRAYCCFGCYWFATKYWRCGLETNDAVMFTDNNKATCELQTEMRTLFKAEQESEKEFVEVFKNQGLNWSAGEKVVVAKFALTT